MKRNKEQVPLFGLTLLIICALVVLSLFSAITFGNADLSITDVYRVVGYKLFHIEALSDFGNGAVHDVVWLIRLPRVLLALMIGSGLSVSGIVLQAVVKNPLADPYVLGISSGAVLGATLALMLGMGSVMGESFVGIMAFAGAIFAAVLVMMISRAGGRVTSTKLILAGTAVTAVCSAFSNFVLYIANDRDAVASVTFWMLGSLGGASWDKAGIALLVMVPVTLIFWSQYRNLNLMLLGEETAITLGTELHKFRIVYMALAVMMVGIAVYCCGTIAFVGLIIPHGVRMVFGTNHKYIIPVSALVGGIFLIWADVASRVILPYSEIPIGILVSMIGAPCFIYLMVRKAYGGKRK